MASIDNRSPVLVSTPGVSGSPVRNDDTRIIGAEQTANRGVAGGYAPLDSNLLLPVANTMGGSLRAVTGNTTVTSTDGVVVVTPSGATATATLPSPAGITGRRYLIKKAAGALGYPVSVATAAGTIDGNSTEVIMVAGGFRELVSDGTNWNIVGGTVVPVITTVTSPGTGGILTVDATMASVFRCAPGSGITAFALANPINGVDGLQINLEITPVSALSLTITPALTTGIVSPFSITAAKKAFFGLRYSGTTWYLIAATVQS